MTDSGDTLLTTDYSNIDGAVLGEVYDQIVGGDSPTIDDWKARDVENSPVAWRGDRTRYAGKDAPAHRFRA